MRLAYRIAAILATACVGLLAAPAVAQTTVQRSTTTFAILAKPAPEGELVAAPGEPLLRQPIVATRAARLEEEAPSALGLAQAKSFPAGTKMFGVQVPDGWIYCAVSESSVGWLFADAFACYQDTNDDGAFDVVRPSGFPFNGVPLFVFQPGPPKPLTKPVRYSALSYRDGPQSELAIVWNPLGYKAKKGEPPAIPNAISFNAAAIIEKGRKVDLSRPISLETPEWKPSTIRQDGAVITVLGFTKDGYLRYRVDRAMPAQVQPMVMTVTTSTYYYVASY